MSDVTAIPQVNVPRPEAWTGHPLVQLTLVRFLEFIREPEALFWVFIFPILLAAGLGIAFRNRPADVLKIAVVSPQLAQSLRREKLLDVQQLPAGAAEEALRAGKVALAVEPGPGGKVIYKYDDTNPEGRTARMLADGAVQRAAGRVDPAASSDQLMREPGSRYIDFLIPGLLGMNLMGSAIWGMGFAIVDARRKKLMKRLVATPMPQAFFPAVVRAVAAGAAGGGSRGGAGLRRGGVWRPVSRVVPGSCAAVRAGVHGVQRAGIAAGVAGADHRGGLRLDEYGDDADVDCVGGVFFGAAISGFSAAGD